MSSPVDKNDLNGQASPFWCEKLIRRRLSLDRLPSNELTMTQELIANMLGVRREGVKSELDPDWQGVGPAAHAAWDRGDRDWKVKQ